MLRRCITSTLGATSQVLVPARCVSMPGGPPALKRVRNNYRRQSKRQVYFDRLQLETISESDLLPPKIRAQAAADLDQLPQYSHKNAETDQCVLTGHVLGVVLDYKVNRVIFRNLAHNGQIAGLKYWRYPNYSKWDKEKLSFRLIQLQHDPYYKKMAEDLCHKDPEFQDVFMKQKTEHKVGVKTNDYLWCTRRNFTPDKTNEDYRF